MPRPGLLPGPPEDNDGCITGDPARTFRLFRFLSSTIHTFVTENENQASMLDIIMLIADLVQNFKTHDSAQKNYILPRI